MLDAIYQAYTLARTWNDLSVDILLEAGTHVISKKNLKDKKRNKADKVKKEKKREKELKPFTEEDDGFGEGEAEDAQFLNRIEPIQN